MSMSSQWAKARVIASPVRRSASMKLSSVASEKTTPKPKVSSARLRSKTTTSWVGSAFFISKAKYSPAGPPPIETILTVRLYRKPVATHGRPMLYNIATELLTRGGVHERDGGCDVRDEEARGDRGGRAARAPRARGAREVGGQRRLPQRLPRDQRRRSASAAGRAGPRGGGRGRERRALRRERQARRSRVLVLHPVLRQVRL